MAVPPLRTTRLRLDPLDPGRDADALAALWADGRFSAFEVDDPPTTREAVLARLAWVGRMPDGLGGWALRLLDEAAAGPRPLVGRVSLREWEHDPAGPPELGWHLAPPYWGRGLATEAMEAVLAHAAGRMGLATVVALVRSDNARSLAVAHRLGARPVERGRWYGPDHEFVRFEVDLVAGRWRGATRPAAR